MSTRHRLVINECLWVCGGSQTSFQRHAIRDLEGLRQRGAKIFVLKSHKDTEGLEQLRQLLRQTDDHVILGWMEPYKLAAVYPLIRERKNFSIIGDDWWIVPNWFMREASYILFRKYNGIALYLGQAPFVQAGEPPFFFNPYPQLAIYSVICALLRPPMVVAAPLVDWWNRRRRDEPVTPEKYLYFPWAINADDMAGSPEVEQYDFANTAGTVGVWAMRNPRVPARYSFASLYEDRRRLIDLIARFENAPFKFYDCRRGGNFWLPYDEYMRKTRQSRFVVATGGLQDAALHKFLEYLCLGTPMIGRGLPFEYPWLDDCLFPVDTMHVTPERLKPLLDQALERYPVMKDNCLKWRERVLALHNIHRILDMVQDQADGKPVPPGYLKVDLKQSAGKA
ncbi:MAG TPA: hypothetical protein VMB80_12910 [Candidatus Acidoferrum sp.]|nr:hypothetical protein [Candidatus Acidoferrum sp.]